MSGLTLRERAEEAVKAATNYEIELNTKGSEASADDFAQLTTLANTAGELCAQVKAATTSGSTLKNATEFLKGLGVDPGETTHADPQDKMSSDSGIAKPRPGMTLGQVFAESPAYKEFVAAHAGASGAISENFSGQSSKLDIAASLFSANGQLGFNPQNTLVTTAGAADDAGFVEKTMLPGYVNEAPMAESYLWDLCTKVPVTGEGFKYARLVSVENNAAFVAEATSAGVLASDLSAGGVSDAAGGLKPESGFQWGQASGTVETVAHWIPITRQAAADAPQVMAIINAFLIDGLQVAIEDSIMNGDGNSPNLRGVLNGTNPYTNIHSVATGAGNRFDAILTAIQTIRGSNRIFRPSAVIINDSDFFSTTFVAAKDGNGDWLFGGPASGSPASFPLWGMQVVLSSEIPTGTQLVGDWRYALIADRERAQLYMTDSHRDFFTRNLLTILAEQRLGFGLMAEQAFAQVVA